MQSPANRSAARFDSIARNFATSEVHKSSPTIALLQGLLKERSVKSVCDIACGAGHLGLSFAESAQRIVGVDPAPAMLSAFYFMAKERGIEVESHCSVAEQLPLASNTFDAVVSRLAPHHFLSIESALAEMVRIARPGGIVAVIDLQGASDPEIDEFNHTLEMLHDPTHVRSYTAAAWRKFFLEAGLKDIGQHAGLSESPAGVPVKRWCEIASSGSEAEAAIVACLSRCEPTWLEALGISRHDAAFYMPIRTVLTIGSKAVSDADG